MLVLVLSSRFDTAWLNDFCPKLPCFEHVCVHESSKLFGFFSDHGAFLVSVSTTESFSYRKRYICISEGWQWWWLHYLLWFLWSSSTGIVYFIWSGSQTHIFLYFFYMVSEQASQCCLILQLNLTGHHHGLIVEETEDLWVQADIDRNGIVDYKEFQVSFHVIVSKHYISTCQYYWFLSLISTN